MLPYDRPGFHNWCIIGFRKIGDLEADVDANPDKLLEQAISICRSELEEDLDGLVDCIVQPLQGWEDEVERLVGGYPGKEPDDKA